MAPQLSVAVRVDAGPAIGVGHAMRCATLSAALTGRGHAVSVVTSSMPDWVAARFVSCGAAIVSESTTPVDVWVVDGYELGDELSALAASETPVVAVDDNHELPVAAARLVVNQNLHATPALYADTDSAETTLLLGPAYALIRTDVTEIERERHADGGRTVLVSFGGTDPAGLTAPVVERLLDTADTDVIIALGTGHPDRTRVQSLVDRSGHRARFDRGDLVEGFRLADVAVIGGGSTLWEVASLGIPSIAAVVADNQVAGTAAAASAGFVVGIDVRAGRHDADDVAAAVLALLADRHRQEELASAGVALFDGRGAERIVGEIESIA